MCPQMCPQLVKVPPLFSVIKWVLNTPAYFRFTIIGPRPLPGMAYNCTQPDITSVTANPRERGHKRRSRIKLSHRPKPPLKSPSFHQHSLSADLIISRTFTFIGAAVGIYFAGGPGWVGAYTSATSRYCSAPPYFWWISQNSERVAR